MSRLALALTGLVLVSLFAAGGFVKIRFGGGTPFPHAPGPATVSQVEVAATLPLPPGCIAVSPEGRVFFDTHPFAAPARFGEPHLFELVDGTAVPWPSLDAQQQLVAPFGLTVHGGLLWLTEPATLDRAATRLVAFDLTTGALAREIVLPNGVGRFAQDLRVSPDGRSIVLADTGMLGITEGHLLVVDLASGSVVRRWAHPSMSPGPWTIRRFDGKPHRVLWGLVSFRVGVDGITFSSDGAWLYYATMSSDSLHRVPTQLVVDPATPPAVLDAAVEMVGRKPQSDGIALAADGSVLLAAVEDGGIARVSPTGRLDVLTRNTAVVWADGVAVGPDGAVWFTDSAIPAYLRQDLRPPTRSALETAGPYHLYRFLISNDPT